MAKQKLYLPKFGYLHRMVGSNLVGWFGGLHKLVGQFGGMNISPPYYAKKYERKKEANLSSD